ncbi:hypothetical protein, partial [uncultured Prevotella sp.]|uniref:hypothetical protein n=1 Tax=uncultured Prevotella sp. TaxID=159272 RepID=UPI0026663C8A
LKKEISKKTCSIRVKQGVLLFSIRTPKALPWAMCFWGFQPVLLTFDTPSYVLIGLSARL